MGFLFDATKHVQRIQKKQSTELNERQDIEEIVYEHYKAQILDLNIKQCLKTYLLKTLQGILMSENNERILLLDLRKHLKKTSKYAQQIEYEDFLMMIDALYQLAIDKFFFYDFRKTSHHFLVERDNSQPLLARIVQVSL